MTDCGRQCYVIGGPWISSDPDCPVHGTEAQKKRDDWWERKDKLRDLKDKIELYGEETSCVTYNGWWRWHDPKVLLKEIFEQIDGLIGPEP